MFHQRVNSALGGCIGWDRPDNAACRERCDQNDTASFRQDRKQLLNEKEGGADVDGEQPIEILNGGFFDGGGFRTPRISDRISRRSPTMSRAILASLCGPSALSRS